MQSKLESLFRDGRIWCAEPDSSKKSGEGVFFHSGELLSANISSANISSANISADITDTKKPAAPFGVPDIDCSLPHGGLAFGYTHEWFSSPYENTLQPSGSLLTLIAGKALQIADEQSFIIWIGRNCWPAPYLLKKTLPKNSLQNCIFIDPPDSKLLFWSIETALRSSAVLAVIACCENISFPLSKRFSLAAKKGSSLGLFIRKEKELHVQSASCSKWLLKPALSPSLSPRWDLELVKLKGSRSKQTRWTIEYYHELKDEQISVHIPSDVVSKPGSEAAPAAKQKRG